MTTASTHPLVGDLVDGRYRVLRHLADGGMATVLLATDTRLYREVALKVMRPDLAADETFVSRFRREARSAARLSHPHVVPVFDQGEDDGQVFLAMEYVEGRTAREVIDAEGALTPRAALDILEPVLTGLAAAHAAGYIHRDVKPENVLISDSGKVKLADKGVRSAKKRVDPLRRQTGVARQEVIEALMNTFVSRYPAEVGELSDADIAAGLDDRAGERRRGRPRAGRGPRRHPGPPRPGGLRRRCGPGLPVGDPPGCRSAGGAWPRGWRGTRRARAPGSGGPGGAGPGCGAGAGTRDAGYRARIVSSSDGTAVILRDYPRRPRPIARSENGRGRERSGPTPVWAYWRRQRRSPDPDRGAPWPFERGAPRDTPAAERTPR